MEPCIFYDINKERDTILHNSREKRGTERERETEVHLLSVRNDVCAVLGSGVIGGCMWSRHHHLCLRAPAFSCSTTDLGTSGELQVSDLRKVGCTGGGGGAETTCTCGTGGATSCSGGAKRGCGTTNCGGCCARRQGLSNSHRTWIVFLEAQCRALRYCVIGGKSMICCAVKPYWSELRCTAESLPGPAPAGCKKWVAGKLVRS